jgi:hypothetical protein
MPNEFTTPKIAWTAPKLQRLQVQQAQNQGGSKPGDAGDNKKS